MKILLTICARGGSKGIPGKNIKPLNGRPLLDYTIQAAKRFQATHPGTDIVLSTDAQAIREVAKTCGLDSDYQRPDALGGDTVGKIDVLRDVLLWQEAATGLTYDILLDLDVTSPLRTQDDLSKGLELLLNNPEAVNLFSVSPAGRNPYFNMVEQQENGYYAQVKKLPSTVLSRQAAPRVYDMNASFYVYKRAFFTLGYTGAITDKSLIYEMPHTCFDLDEPIDFEFVTYLLSTNKLTIE
jgi:CMP-N-acetylneuraminic acid synthetase